MRDYYFFIVEGPHDSAAIGRLLRPYHCKIVQKLENVDSFWARLIPKSFPYQNDLLRRMPVPVFYQNDTISVAIYSAGGEKNIPIALDSLLNIAVEELAGLAVFFDADEENPKDKFEKMHQEIVSSIDEELYPFIEGLHFNEIKSHPIKSSFFIFPNNEEKGTLEDILLEGGKIVYGDILGHAEHYLENIPPQYKEKWSEAKYAKSLFGVTANILQPGSANQVSIQRNEWINEETVTQTSQQNLKRFIDGILEPRIYV